MSIESVFHWHYKQRSWGRDRESISGPGSTTRATSIVRAALRPLLEEFGVRTLLDIPCGDGNWMSQANLDLDLYIGADIVQELIDLNLRRWNGRSSRKFLKLDLTSDALPYVDLVLCRDGLVHLSDAQVLKALRNIKQSGSKYLLATTFPELLHNLDIVTGDWRPMNLQREPFNLPQPLKLILEGRAGPDYRDKSLGLWRITDLPREDPG